MAFGAPQDDPCRTEPSVRVPQRQELLEINFLGIDRSRADALLAEGHRAEPVGAELAPAKTIVFVGPDRIPGLASARQIDVSLSAELLSSECLALVRF